MGAKWFVLSLITVMTAASLFRFAAEIDGSLLPVISDVEITDIERVDPMKPAPVNIYGSFFKRRDCPLQDINWYFGLRSSSSTGVAVKTELGEPTATKPGLQSFGPLEVVMSESSIRNNSYATATHDCYGGWLWKTTTVFWDSNTKNPIGRITDPQQDDYVPDADERDK